MGAYDNPRIIRDTSGQIYGQAIATFGKQFGDMMKSYAANQKAEQEKADKEIERVQRIANQVESRFYDQANRNYALVAREDKTLLKGFQNEVGNLLNGVGVEGEEGYQIGAIKAQTYLDTKNDLTTEERQYYREVVQRAKIFQNNAIAGGGQIINDLQDMNKVKPSDIASTHYWTGANDTERDTTMLTAYALDGKEVDGVASEKKVYSGRNGEMIVKVTSKVKEGSKTWNNLSEETQEHLRNNNYELTWEKDMNNFEELIGEVPEGLDYNQVAENSKFQKDGKLNSNFIVGGDEGSQYTTKSVIGGKKEEITSLRFLNINKLLNDETFKADIKGKAEGFVNMDNGKLNAFMRYTMKDGSFKITEFREKTPQEQEKYIQEALRQSFINEKTSGNNMGSKQADPRDVAHFEKLGVAIEEGETVYYQITGRNVVNKQNNNNNKTNPQNIALNFVTEVLTNPKEVISRITGNKTGVYDKATRTFSIRGQKKDPITGEVVLDKNENPIIVDRLFKLGTAKGRKDFFAEVLPQLQQGALSGNSENAKAAQDFVQQIAGSSMKDFDMEYPEGPTVKDKALAQEKLILNDVKEASNLFSFMDNSDRLEAVKNNLTKYVDDNPQYKGKKLSDVLIAIAGLTETADSTINLMIQKLKESEPPEKMEENT